jgi:hypothetical protein
LAVEDHRGEGTILGRKVIVKEGGERGFHMAVLLEPSTYALLGLGALALVIAYRRRVA